MEFADDPQHITVIKCPNCWKGCLTIEKLTAHFLTSHCPPQLLGKENKDGSTDFELISPGHPSYSYFDFKGVSVSGAAMSTGILSPFLSRHQKAPSCSESDDKEEEDVCIIRDLSVGSADADNVHEGKSPDSAEPALIVEYQKRSRFDREEAEGSNLEPDEGQQEQTAVDNDDEVGARTEEEPPAYLDIDRPITEAAELAVTVTKGGRPKPSQGQGTSVPSDSDPQHLTVIKCPDCWKGCLTIEKLTAHFLANHCPPQLLGKENKDGSTEFELISPGHPSYSYFDFKGVSVSGAAMSTGILSPFLARHQKAPSCSESDDKEEEEVCIIRDLSVGSADADNEDEGNSADSGAPALMEEDKTSNFDREEAEGSNFEPDEGQQEQTVVDNDDELGARTEEEPPAPLDIDMPITEGAEGTVTITKRGCPKSSQGQGKSRNSGEVKKIVERWTPVYASDRAIIGKKGPTGSIFIPQHMDASGMHRVSARLRLNGRLEKKRNKENR